MIGEGDISQYAGGGYGGAQIYVKMTSPTSNITMIHCTMVTVKIKGTACSLYNVYAVYSNS